MSSARWRLDQFVLDREAPAPLHHQIRQRLTQSIRDGGLRTGEQLPSVKDICRAFGVSLGPVMRALNDMKRDGVIVARRGAGNYVAERPLPTTEVIILQGHPHAGYRMDFFQQLLDGIARGHGDGARRAVVSFFPSEHLPSAREVVELCRVKHADGAVFYGVPERFRADLAAVAARIPSVVLFAGAGSARADAVRASVGPTLRRLLAERIAAGRGDFAFLGVEHLLRAPDDDFSPYHQLRHTFEEVMREAGIAAPMHVGPTREAVVSAASRCLPDGCVVVTAGAGLGPYLLQSRCADVITYTEYASTLHAFEHQATMLYLGFDAAGEAAARLLAERREVPDRPPRVMDLAPIVVEPSRRVGS